MREQNKTANKKIESWRTAIIYLGMSVIPSFFNSITVCYHFSLVIDKERISQGAYNESHYTDGRNKALIAQKSTKIIDTISRGFAIKMSERKVRNYEIINGLAIDFLEPRFRFRTRKMFEEVKDEFLTSLENKLKEGL